MGVLDSISKSLQKTNTDVKNVSNNIFNSNPSQKSGKLGGIAQSITGITKTVTGTVSDVGHVVAKVSGSLGGAMGGKLRDALEGKSNPQWFPNSEITGLKAFYKKFNDYDKDGQIFDTSKIDVLNTFECTFTFYPNKNDTCNNVTKDENFLQFINEKQINIPIDPRFSYKDNKENLSANVQNNNLLDLGIYIQSITVPQMQQYGSEDINTMLGTFHTTGNIVQPDSKKLTMEIVNTSRSLHENIFYPWMREVTLPVWVYKSQPYTTATIELDFSEHSNVKYVFYGCRPSSIQTYQPSQEAQTNFSRQVQFDFDWMFIEETNNFNYKSKDTQKPLIGFIESGQSDNKASGIANAVGFAASNILKI